MIADLTKKTSITNHMWLKWDSLEHVGNGIIKLNKPSFYGPVLQDCEPVEPAGSINLDLTPHFMLILTKPYFVELSWDKLLSQSTKEATFESMLIKDNDLGKLALLTDSDKIFLNCKDQTTEAMAAGKLKAAFEVMVFNGYDEPYDLSK